MTANQINYAKHLEDVRTHKTTEAIAARQAAASERQASASELQAQNSARQASVAEMNAYTQRMNAESQRISAEAAQRSSLASVMSAQASMSLAGIKQQELYEAQRHNAATEALTGLQIQTSERMANVQTGATLLGTVVRTLGGLVGHFA